MIVAHLADIHLGFRQYHRQNPLGINQREADIANAFRSAVDGILEARPQAVLIAGDLFHQVRPTNAAIVFAYHQFQRLRSELPDAPIVVIAGNHDTPRSSETGSILRLYAELGIDVAHTEPRRLVYPALGLSVLAVPYQALRESDRPALRPEPGDGIEHQVLLLHGEVEGVYPPEVSGALWGGVMVREMELNAAEWSYVALGHYHVQHEVAPRVWYAGALDYVTSNPWGELRDEERRGVAGKGWLLADLARGTVERRPAAVARRVIDLPPLYADGLTAEQLDTLLDGRLAEIPGGWTDQIVRQVVHQVPRHLTRMLDHGRIRQVKAEALHYRLDLRRPDQTSGVGLASSGRRLPLPEVLRDFLEHRALPAELDRSAFVQRGTALLDAVAREEEEA